MNFAKGWSWHREGLLPMAVTFLVLRHPPREKKVLNIGTLQGVSSQDFFLSPSRADLGTSTFVQARAEPGSENPFFFRDRAELSSKIHFF